MLDAQGNAKLGDLGLATTIRDRDEQITRQLSLVDEDDADTENADDTATVRSVFVVGPDNAVKLTLTYPASTGRNFDELLRVIDSLQLTAGHKVATPANWKKGEDVIVVPAVSDDDARAQHGAFEAKLPYLRMVKQPG